LIVGFGGKEVRRENWGRKPGGLFLSYAGSMAFKTVFMTKDPGADAGRLRRQQSLPDLLARARYGRQAIISGV